MTTTKMESSPRTLEEEVSQAGLDSIADPLRRADSEHKEIEVGSMEARPDGGDQGLLDITAGLRDAFATRAADGSKPPPPGKDGDATTMPRRGDGGMRLDVTLDPEKVTGSAMVVNAVDASDEAADAMSLTQQFLNEHLNNPYAEEEDLWSKAVQNDRNPGGFLSSYKPDQKAPTPEPELMFRQFPQMQQSTTRLDPSYSGKIMPMNRQALVISNGDYPGTGSDLDWAHKDGGSMKKYFSSQGYETTYLKDVSGGDISKALKSTSKQNFFPGDSVAVYYVGHGDQTGLIGTDFTSAPYTALNTIALGALSGGYHAQIITDCCHSGAMVGSLSKTLETEFGNVKRDFTELSIDTEKAASQDLHKFDENGKMSKEILDKANQRELYTTRF